MLLVFKAARRQEYLQENLRILGAARGETVETAYALRWQSEGVRDRVPEPGDETLIVFTSRPYQRFTPVRFARVVEATANEGTLRLTLELGSRAHAPDHDRWHRFVTAGPNPSEASQVWVSRSDEGVRRAADEAERAKVTVPVEYVSAAGEERAWRRAIDRLTHDDDYARAVFLRVGAVHPADAPPTARPLEPPYALEAERPYVVRLVSYNPHLDDDFRRDVRLVPFYDELATAVVLDDPNKLPGDGIVELMLEPIVTGPGWLELHASRGVDFLLAARLGWKAAARPAEMALAPGPAELEAEALEALRSLAPLRPPLQGEAERPPVAGAIPIGDDVAPPEAGLPIAPWLVPTRALDAAVRAFELVRDETGASPETQLRLLDVLVDLAPRDVRLLEQRGVALYALGRYAEAARALRGIPLDTMGREGRATFVASLLRLGQLPEPVEQVRVADLSRDDAFVLVLDASASLAAVAQVRLAEFVCGHLLSDDRAGSWLETVTSRPLSREALRRLVEIWQYIDPDRAARVLDHLVNEGRLDLADERVAQLLYDLARGAGLPGAMRAAADALIEEAARRRDAVRLVELLRRVRGDLRRDDAHVLGERLVRAIADAIPEHAPIDQALLAAADFIEDHRQTGNLDQASALATFAAANLARASEAARTRLEEVLDALEEALRASATFRAFATIREREANLDLRKAVAGLRFLFVGGKRPAWYGALRAELAIHEKSEWLESESRKAPPPDALQERLKRGQWAGVVLFTDRVGHKTSQPLMRLCRTHEVKLIEARLTREGLLAALREHFGP